MSVAYLHQHIVKRVRRVNEEADENDVWIRIQERMKSIIVVLPRHIPQCQFNVLVVYKNLEDGILKYSGIVILRERPWATMQSEMCLVK